MPRKSVVPAAVADALTELKPPSATARAVSVIAGDRGDELAAKTIDDLTFEILALQIQGNKVLLAIGKRLIAAKDKLPHGDWLPWLESVNIPERLAQRYMKLAREWSSNPSILSDLGMSKALALLALPDDIRAEFVAEGHIVNGEEKSVVDMSAKELADAIKARKEAESALEMTKQALSTSERRLTETEQQLAKVKTRAENFERKLNNWKFLCEDKGRILKKAEDELAALKAKPVDVAVQKVVDPDALEQARKEVREKMQMDLDFARSDADAARQSLQSAKADAEKAETARKAAEQALDDANKAAKDAAQDAQNARQELERVKAEKAPIGDKDLSLFAVLFEQTQAAVNQMHGILLKQDSGRQEQMRKSLSALADTIGKKAVQ